MADETTTPKQPATASVETPTAPAPPAAPSLPASHPGVPDGTVLNGEKVVHELDEKGNVVGWHKEVANG